MSGSPRQTVAARWSAAILVCGKCSKKLGGGFGDKGKTPLAKALRKRAGKGRKRKADYGVVEVKCLGVCPKHAVVTIDGAHPEEWLLVRGGTPVDEVAERLGLPFISPP